MTPLWLLFYRVLPLMMFTLFFALYIAYLCCFDPQNQEIIILLFLVVLVYKTFYFRIFIIVLSLVIWVFPK